jgi:hypothetical protein
MYLAPGPRAAAEAAETSNTEPKEEVTAEEIELDLTRGTLEKTNDPVRMYLREMGTVPLLTREGEVAVAIAKRLRARATAGAQDHLAIPGRSQGDAGDRRGALERHPVDQENHSIG